LQLKQDQEMDLFDESNSIIRNFPDMSNEKKQAR